MLGGFVHLGDILRGKIAQHPVCQVIVLGGLCTYAYLYAWEILRACKIYDGLYAVMAAVASLSANAQLAGLKAALDALFAGLVRNSSPPPQLLRCCS